MKLELASISQDKGENSLTIHAEHLEPEYYIEEGWSEYLPPKQKGLAFRIQDNRHYGRCFPFLYFNGEPLCLLGPDWPYSLGLLVMFVLIFSNFKSVCLRESNPLLSYIAFVFVQSVFMLSFIALAIKNPGARTHSKEVQYVEDSL